MTISLQTAEKYATVELPRQLPDVTEENKDANAEQATINK
jgi:hypothetical protein